VLTCVVEAKFHLNFPGGGVIGAFILQNFSPVIQSYYSSVTAGPFPAIFSLSPASPTLALHKKLAPFPSILHCPLQIRVLGKSPNPKSTCPDFRI